MIAINFVYYVLINTEAIGILFTGLKQPFCLAKQKTIRLKFLFKIFCLQNNIYYLCPMPNDYDKIFKENFEELIPDLLRLVMK